MPPRTHLVSRSEHFRAWLYRGTRESSAATEPIALPDIPHVVFLLLLEYIYTDQVDEIGSRLATPLLIAADLFWLDRLKALCEDIIRKSISIDNMV